MDIVPNMSMLAVIRRIVTERVVAMSRTGAAPVSLAVAVSGAFLASPLSRNVVARKAQKMSAPVKKKV